MLTRTDGNYISFYAGPDAHARHLQKELKLSADTVPQQGCEVGIPLQKFSEIPKHFKPKRSHQYTHVISASAVVC